MFLSLLNRMILWELIKIFAISLFGMTGLMLMGGLVSEATQQGVGLGQIFLIIPLFIPSLLPYTIPTTTLFATCLVYGRLAADNEILAIRAAGVSLVRILWPAVFLGLVISAATMGLYYRAIPSTHHLMRRLVLKDVQELLYATLKKERGISHPRLDYSLFVKQVQGRKLLKATFKRRDKNGRYDLIIQADEAELAVDLPRGKIVVTMRYGEAFHVKDGTYVAFPEREVEVDLSSALATHGQPRPRDMTWAQLHDHRGFMREEAGRVDRELAEAREGRLTNHAPELLPQHVANLNYRKEFCASEVRQVEAEFHMRPALALGCLCFVLIGVPVGIRFSRGDYLSAFISCFLPIVFVYYPLMLCGTNLAKDGRLPPAVAVWAANALVALAGLVLYARLLRR